MTTSSGIIFPSSPLGFKAFESQVQAYARTQSKKPNRMIEAITVDNFVPKIDPVEPIDDPTSAAGERVWKHYSRLVDEASDEQRGLDATKLAIIDSCPEAAKQLIASLNSDRSKISLFKIIEILRSAYGRASQTDIDFATNSLSDPYIAGSDMFTHVARISRTVELLNTYHVPTPEITKVGHLQASLRNTHDFELVLSMYHAQFPEVADANFEALAKALRDRAAVLSVAPPKLFAVSSVAVDENSYSIGDLNAAMKASSIHRAQGQLAPANLRVYDSKVFKLVPVGATSATPAFEKTAVTSKPAGVKGKPPRKLRICSHHGEGHHDSDHCKFLHPELLT